MPNKPTPLKVLCDSCMEYRLRDQRPGRRCYLSIPNGGNRFTCTSYSREPGSDDEEPLPIYLHKMGSEHSGKH